MLLCYLVPCLLTCRPDTHQIPVFVPFLACFCGALAYDVFIYTGDSPINNGEWSPTRVWNSIRIDRKMRTKRRQSDEETLDVNGCEQDLESTTTCDRRMSSRSQESRSDVSGWLDRNQSNWSDVQEGPRTAKPVSGRSSGMGCPSPTAIPSLWTRSERMTVTLQTD